MTYPRIIARLVSSKLNFASSPEIILKRKTNAFILVKEISKSFSPKHKMDADWNDYHICEDLTEPIKRHLRMHMS